MDSEDFQNIEELYTYIDQQITRSGEGHKRNICNQTSRKRAHIKEHIEIHINGQTLNFIF